MTAVSMPGVIRGLLLDHPQPLLMGIINVTPDSFYDGGSCNTIAEVVRQAERMVEAGAQLLDIGGESTRPGSRPVPESEELERVIPVIEALKRAVAVPLSIDTRKSNVAAAALQAGARIVNDISALREDFCMAGVVAQAQADLIIMHMQGTPLNMQQDPVYSNTLREVQAFLQERIETAVAAGIARRCITIDPGIGFGKRLQDNLALLANLDACRVDDCPLLIGASRKSFINKLQPNTTPAERLPGTLAAHLFSIASGDCEILRVHDVSATVQALSVWRALQNAVTAPGKSRD